MEVIRKLIQDYTILFVFVNILEGILSLYLLLSPKKREWFDSVICLYGGFLFGMVPAFLILEDIFVALICCMLLSAAFIFVQNKLKTGLYLPLGILIFKILLIAGITLLADQYSSNMFGFYLKVMFVSVLVFCVINIPYEVPAEQQHCIIRLFALSQLSGAIIQFYRNDYIAFDKGLYDIKESVSFFLYLLKVDFWIFDYQYPYIMCFLVLLFIYFIWRKSISYFKK